MKTRFLQLLVLFAGLSAVLTATIVDSWAQETTGAPPISVIKVENVRAKVMEFWVKPRKNSVPVPQNEDKKPTLNGFALSNGLPGLENIVANEAKNELWVKGTPESIRKLKEIIAFLDRPVKQLEIKAQIVDVDAAEVTGPGRFTDPVMDKLPNSVSKSQTLVFETEFQDKIKELIAAGKAKVLHAAQTTVSNNSTSSISWDENSISPRIELQATPTIQNDKTITLFLTPKIGERVLGQPNLSSRMSNLTTVANIRDDIVVLRLDDLETLRSEGARRVTLFLVSARILED